MCFFALVFKQTKFQIIYVCDCRHISNGPHTEPCGTPLSLSSVLAVACNSFFAILVDKKMKLYEIPMKLHERVCGEER